MRRVLAVAAILAIGLALLAGCSKSKPRLTLNEYVTQFQVLGKQADADSSRLAQEKGFGPDKSYDENRAFYLSEASVVDRFARELDDLRPPAKIEEQHRAIVAGYHALAANFRTGLGGQDIPGRLAAACSAIEQLAADQGNPVELCLSGQAQP